MRIVILGLSLSSSWGNGHATTFRALIGGLAELGHDVLFLERDVPWYAGNRDLPEPGFCTLRYYDDLAGLEQYAGDITGADAVIVGSYVPDGVAVIDRVLALAPRRTCFYDIDTPVTLARLARGDAAYLAPRQIPSFARYFSFTGGPTLQRLEREYGSPRAVALHCAVDPARYHPTGDAPVWDMGYLGTYSDDRQPVLERLLIEPARRLPRRRFVVAGPQYPAGIDWPTNVERIEHIAPADHAAFYSRQRFTLNVTRADMVAAGWSPSVRLFEAAACGTAIISDAWDGLTALLPEPAAIRLARTPEDVVAILEDTDDAGRAAQAHEARRRVLEGHTGVARAAQLADELMMLNRNKKPVETQPAAVTLQAEGR